MPSRRRRRRSPVARSPLPPRSLPSLPLRASLRRRSTLWLAGAIVLLAIAALLNALARDGGDEASDRPIATPTLAVALPDLQPDDSALMRAEVVGVIDGDTIDVHMDGRDERVRYFGVDTPERGDPCYREATERNEELVADGVLMLPDARERDRSGRLLRYVFDENGRSIDARLIAEGLARAWPEDGAYRDDLVALEGAARAAGVGCLWGRLSYGRA
ncbi:MAG: thermonuclease family protein [Chloroflexi bacterium]|nr:thermonuclease family protein [Chloroflexota bacterium]